MALTESTMLELGTIAPDFALTDVIAEKTVRRDDFRGNQALLVLFICVHCPYVKHIQANFTAFAKEYQARGLAVVGINSNDVENYPGDRPESCGAIEA